VRGAPRSVGWALVVLGVSVWLAGCGREGPPVPPHVPQAVAPQGLSFRAEGDTLELTWRYPAQALPPRWFRVLRADIDPACLGCPPMFYEVGTVGWQEGGDYLFRVHDLKMGAIYAYQVLPVFGEKVEGPTSAALRLTWRDTPPPTGLAAAAEAAGVRLFWEPETDVRSYVIYRAEGAQALSRLAEVEVPPYLDATVRPGATYRYSVAAVGKSGEGPLSAPVEATLPLYPAGDA